MNHNLLRINPLKLLDLVLPGRPEQPNPAHYYLVFRDPKDEHPCAALTHGTSPDISCDLIVGYLDMGALSEQSPWVRNQDDESPLALQLAASGFRVVHAGGHRTSTYQKRILVSSLPSHVAKRIFANTCSENDQLRYVRVFVTASDPVRINIESSFGVHISYFTAETIMGREIIKALFHE